MKCMNVDVVIMSRIKIQTNQTSSLSSSQWNVWALTLFFCQESRFKHIEPAHCPHHNEMYERWCCYYVKNQDSNKSNQLTVLITMKCMSVDVVFMSRTKIYTYRASSLSSSQWNVWIWHCFYVKKQDLNILSQLTDLITMKCMRVDVVFMSRIKIYTYQASSLSSSQWNVWTLTLFFMSRSSFKHIKPTHYPHHNEMYEHWWFLVAWYASLHPAMLVSWLVGWLVGQSVPFLLFWRFELFEPTAPAQMLWWPSPALPLPTRTRLG